MWYHILYLVSALPELCTHLHTASTTDIIAWLFAGGRLKRSKRFLDLKDFWDVERFKRFEEKEVLFHCLSLIFPWASQNDSRIKWCVYEYWQQGNSLQHCFYLLPIFSPPCVVELSTNLREGTEGSASNDPWSCPCVMTLRRRPNFMSTYFGVNAHLA